MLLVGRSKDKPKVTVLLNKQEASHIVKLVYAYCKDYGEHKKKRKLPSLELS